MQHLFSSNARQALIDENTRTKLEKWLQPANVALSLRDAAEKRHEKTGIWLIERAEYREWIYAPHSLLWLHGISGSGKTILSSTIINTLRKRAEPIAFFYFDTNNSGQQTVTQLLCSLVTQLSVQTPTPDMTLAALWGSCARGQQLPTTSTLISEALIPILREFTQPVYIVIDALDECSECNKLLNSITQIVDAQLSSFHLLLTSRPEVPCITCAVSVSLEGCVDQDIESYVTEIMADLDVDWTPERKAQIKAGLLERSGGMFRLVSLQLEQLRGCDGRESQITKALADMPTSLETIYDRILQNIKNPDMVSTVFHAMNWFIFSKRPIELAEIVDALAFDFEKKPLRFTPAERMAPKALLQACAGFVVESTDKQGHIIVKLAHASVKEYFLSVKHSTDLSGDLEVSEQKAHDFIARTCIGYLCSPSHALITDVDLYQYPLMVYALENWAFHVNRCDETGLAQGQEVEPHKPNMLNVFSVSYWLNLVLFSSLRMSLSSKSKTVDQHSSNPPPLIQAVLGLLQPNSPQYTTLCRVVNIEGSYIRAQEDWSSSPILPPLYIAACLGICQAVCELLQQGADMAAEGGSYCNALQVASSRGHTKIVRRLLEQGAEVNAEGGEGYNSALQAASSRGHVNLVHLLLDHGADVNMQGGRYGNALQCASIGGHAETVCLLLDRGADVNAEGGFHGSALQAACVTNHTEIAHLLLERGAEVNIKVQGIFHANALQAACNRGQISIVRLLLEHGAEVNAQAGPFGNALQIACRRGHSEIVRILLEQGAEVNAQGGYFGNALQAACYGGNIDIVHWLLEHGADVKPEGGTFGNALQAASLNGNTDIIRLLFEHGADAKAEGGEYSSALQAASSRGSTEIVRLLLEQGAEVHVQGGYYGNALQAACFSGQIEIVHMLLDLGADVNARGGHHETALQAACLWGHIEVVRLLLGQGAEMEVAGGYYGNALGAACQQGHIETVHILLENGADVNAKGTAAGNALQAASYKGHIEIVRLLLGHGADVNAQGGRNGTAVQAALAGRHREIVRLLCEHGVELPDQVGSGEDSSSSV
ncbi:ankyrin repeat-containing domain protein [Mycena latifolia]|nr:ankyrin repeat-containing domain protein [Mycena latifolia]